MTRENLPIELRNNQLANKRKNKRRIEGIKRVGRIVFNLGIAVGALRMSSIIGGPIATIVGTGIYLGSGTKAVYEILTKKIIENSMFLQRRTLNGEIKISQSLNIIRISQKLKDFKQPGEKEALMGLEAMVALKNIKQTYEDKGVQTIMGSIGENNVYPQVYSTTTHGANIEMVEALAELGYLEVQRKLPKKKSSLILEKLGFGRYKEAKRELLAMLKKDETYKRQVYDIAFSITDKPVNFEQIYKMYIEMKGRGEKTPQYESVKKIARIFYGLRSKKIDISKNELGETIIDYNAQESFVRRIMREGKNSCKQYRERS